MTTTEPETAAPSDEAALLDYLRDRDVPCPLCRYNLHGLTSTRCPECGRELQITIGLVEPRIGAWVTCVIATAGAGTLGALALVTLVRYGWPGGSIGFRVSFAYFLASVPAVPALLVFRRRFRRLSQPMQWALAFAALLLTGMALVGLAVQ